MMRPLRILLATTQMEAGGAQKALLELASGLQRAGHHVTVLTLYDKAAFIPDFEARYGLTILNLEMKAPNRGALHQLRPFVRGLARLFRMMRDERFDVVQTFQHYSNIIIPPVAWLARVPVRITSQRASMAEAPGWLKWLDRIANNSALVDLMTAVSEDTRRSTIEQVGIRAEKVVAVRNGIDAERYQPTDTAAARRAFRAKLGAADSDLLVTTIGRLATVKGHRYLIEAAPAVLARFPNARFFFAGDGPLEEELRAQVAAAALGDTVHFLGVRSEVVDLLLGSDLFVLPSLMEGLSNAIMEAMAAGLAVVGTRAGGTPELVIDGETGLLVPLGDAAALAEAIIQLLAEPERRAAMAAAGQQRIQAHFTPEANVRAYIDIYERFVTQKGAGV